MNKNTENAKVLLQPTSRWGWLFGLTQKDIDRAATELDKALDGA